MLRDAIAFYNDLLDDQTAVEAQAALNAQMRARRLFFGERAVCNVLRPHFYQPEQWDFLKRETETLLRAFAKAHYACCRDAELRDQLALEPYEETLFSLDIGYEAPWNTSRLDSFYDPDAGRLKFVEYNAETPAGMGYVDEMAEAFLSLEVMHRFQQHYTVRSFTLVRSLLATLLEAYRQWSGKDRPERPQIAIVDWQDVQTLNEHRIIADHMERAGYKAILCDPRTMEFRDGALYVGDFRVDLLYKRVLASELIQRMGIENPIVQALRARAVCMCNAFSAKLMAKKASFALLSDEQNAHLFTAEERAAIEAHIPWTRRVGERHTRFRDQIVDLVPFIAQNKAFLVLKPNDEYGGKGVTIGWEATDEEWAATLRQALLQPYVVQERVEAAFEDYPTVVDGKLHIVRRLVDADPYIYHGKTVSGGLTRLSAAALLNVTAGAGSITPTFIIEKRT
ncbi:MAG: circularly permuted type 2 ATP-grasp protein [Aggregatilineales bacterium]